MKLLPPLIFALAFTIFIGAGCQKTTRRTAPMPSQQAAIATQDTLNEEEVQAAMRSQLEATYTATRALANDPTPDRYLAAVDTTGGDPQMLNEIRETWSQREQILKTAMPPLVGEQSKFIDIQQEGDWVMYYHIVDMGDVALLRGQRFRKTQTGWKMGMAGIVPLPKERFVNFRIEDLLQDIRDSRVMNITQVPSQSSNN